MIMSNSSTKYEEYWQQLGRYLESTDSILSRGTPKRNSGPILIKIITGVWIVATTTERQNALELLFESSNKPERNEELFDLLEEDKETIEKELDIDISLDWRKLVGTKRSIIAISQQGDATETGRGDWGRQHAWFKKEGENFYRVFNPRLKIIATDLGIKH